MIERGANFLTRHRHFNWALADQIIVSGANFLTALLLARYLGPEEFGRFTLEAARDRRTGPRLSTLDTASAEILPPLGIRTRALHPKAGRQAVPFTQLAGAV